MLSLHARGADCATLGLVSHPGARRRRRRSREPVSFPMTRDCLSPSQAPIALPRAACFLAGASAVVYGDRLPTPANPQAGRDRALQQRLGLRAQA